MHTRKGRMGSYSIVRIQGKFQNGALDPWTFESWVISLCPFRQALCKRKYDGAGVTSSATRRLVTRAAFRVVLLPNPSATGALRRSAYIGLTPLSGRDGHRVPESEVAVTHNPA